MMGLNRFCIIWIIFLISCLGCWDGSRYFEEETTQTMPFTPQSNLFVNTQNGSIRINSWDRSEIKIEATRRVRGYPEERAKKILKEIKINIREDDKGVRVETEIPRVIRGDIGVNYNIFIPKKADLSLGTMNGGIRVENIQGDVKTRTMNGGITLIGIRGAVIEGNAMNGGIICNIDTLLEFTNISLETLNGGIRLAIPETPEPSIYARVVNGRIVSDFPIYTRKDAMKGDVIIKLEVMNGGISIKKR